MKEIEDSDEGSRYEEMKEAKYIKEPCEVKKCTNFKAEGDLHFCNRCRIQWQKVCRTQEWNNKTDQTIIELTLKTFKNA